MDIQRSEKVKRNKRIRRILYLILTFAVIGGATVALSKLQPAPPSVESATVVSGEVKRGQMIRNVHGMGTLVPEEIRWIPATVNGRIEKRHVKPGDAVKEDTVLIEMSNPELERDALDAQTEIGADSIKAQIAVYEARVRQFKALYDLRRQQLDALKVRAGLGGVVQDVAVQIGQQVAIGANLARVADPSKLKAEIRIAETQTKDIAIGQRVEIDMRNLGIVEGHVMRIAPAPTQGTLPVDVALDGELPKGARPDMSVDGTIEIERLKDVLYVQRPAQGQEQSVITLFKYVEGGREAVRVQVKLGRSSVTDVEILEGLNVGDRVILSDTSQFDSVNRS